MGKYILALDQGTTSSRAIVFDRLGEIVGMAQEEFNQIYPKPGWVEHNPIEILSSQMASLFGAVTRAGISIKDIDSIGITNQRETTIVWDRETGKPIYNAIVWQCRRTEEYIKELLKDESLDEIVYAKTGLRLDPYFSASKIKWILDNVEGAKEKAKEGKLCFGTVDTYLLWHLTGGEVFATDYTNASRTLLFNIHTLKWDDDILEILDIPLSMLPEVQPSSYIYGEADNEFLGSSIPIAGVAGDQQSALFGQNCFHEGDVKNTYGTGGFLLMNTGKKPVQSKNGLVTTIAWGIGDEITYALEGSVFVAGAAIQWLRDEMRLIDSSDDSEYMANKVPDTNGCYVVPAFTGLGAPYWDPYARGTIVGITRGVNKYHIIRATLQSLALQANDVIRAMEKDSGIELSQLRVDGGASANNLLCQMQSDFSLAPVIRPKCVETTAMGAAYLAGLASGYWQSLEEISKNYQIDMTFNSQMNLDERRAEIHNWHKAVKRSLRFAIDD